jgi:murein DD-endopeptidase MepM/ murein hydrolase activator NlpD
LTVLRQETVLQNATVGTRRLLGRLHSDLHRRITRTIPSLGRRGAERAAAARVRLAAGCALLVALLLRVATATRRGSGTALTWLAVGLRLQAGALYRLVAAFARFTAAVAGRLAVALGRLAVAFAGFAAVALRRLAVALGRLAVAFAHVSASALRALLATLSIAAAACVGRATAARVRLATAFRNRSGAAVHPDRSPGAVLLVARRFLIRARRAGPGSIRAQLTPTLVRDRLLPIGVASLVLAASVLSAASGTNATGGTGNTQAGGDAPRIAIGGDNGGVGGPEQGLGASGSGGTDQGIVGGGADATSAVGGSLYQPDPSLDPQQGPFLDDGTLLMPVAVDTTVADGSSKLTSYKVRSGDTLTGIAHRFGVTMMSVWWANGLSSKDELHVGQTLLIPPVSGLVVTVASGDTLDSISARTDATPDEILSYNDLSDPNLVIGQKLIIPGALGKAIPTPKPQPVAAAAGGGGGGSSRGSSGGATLHPPASTYGGGNFNWPVPGGYISQYFHYGHPALDIAAPYGSRIEAAAGGTVVFAGWKDDMGGYQVWVSHGSGLYTAYYHMSAITVGVGEQVSRGEQIGRVGTSGYATGPHCHFEVWRGYPWEGSSYRVNPLGYL